MVSRYGVPILQEESCLAYTPVTHWHNRLSYARHIKLHGDTKGTPQQSTAYVANTPGYVAGTPCTRGFDIINVHAT